MPPQSVRESLTGVYVTLTDSPWRRARNRVQLLSVCSRFLAIMFPQLRFNPSQVRLKPRISLKHSTWVRFNPTRGRLKLPRCVRGRATRRGFNPSQVRLKPDELLALLELVRAASTPQGDV